jgi:hypothetical protein
MERRSSHTIDDGRELRPFSNGDRNVRSLPEAGRFEETGLARRTHRYLPQCGAH